MSNIYGDRVASDLLREAEEIALRKGYHKPCFCWRNQQELDGAIAAAKRRGSRTFLSRKGGVTALLELPEPEMEWYRPGITLFK